jgi:basic membrane protein A
MVITSMLKRVDTAVFTAGKEFIDGNGNLKAGDRKFGLKEDGVGFAQNQWNKTVLAPYLDQLSRLKTNVVIGNIVVPDESSDMAAWVKALK